MATSPRTRARPAKAAKAAKGKAAPAKAKPKPSKAKAEPVKAKSKAAPRTKAAPAKAPEKPTTPKASSTVADRLAPYHAKRHFDRTPEPAGSGAPAADGHRFVVQRHRARRLHYDLRLEAGGVLVSWAVPKGPTLDPKARRMAVHVEDHPLEYFDFEGVIPRGEYGGGDVIVWDWGTWSSEEPDLDLAAAVRKGEVHVDLHGEKLVGRFVLVRRDDKAGGKEQWLLLHKKDEQAVPGWDPEEHDRSVKSGRTNDEVAADPDATWDSKAPAAEAEVRVARRTWSGPTEEEMEALGGLGAKGTWTVQGQDVKVTNLDKELYPGRDGEPPITKREVLAYHAAIAPAMLPYLADRAVNLNRHPDGAGKKGFWHKAHPATAPEWVTKWRNEDADKGETEWYSVIDSVPALVWAANLGGAVEIHPWNSTTAAPDEPAWAFIDLDPGEGTAWEDLVLLAALHRTALDHLGVKAQPKVTGRRGIQIWIPVGPGYTFDDTRAWVESVSKTIGKAVPDLVSWEWQVDRRKGKARLDYTQNAINKTLVVPFGARPAPGAPVSVPIEWDEIDDPDLRPDRWTIRTVLDRLEERGDTLRPLIGLDQRLPKL
jgi:bifunctional non-homologous end joining protein LigD